MGPSYLIRIVDGLALLWASYVDFQLIFRHVSGICRFSVKKSTYPGDMSTPSTYPLRNARPLPAPGAFW